MNTICSFQKYQDTSNKIENFDTLKIIHYNFSKDNIIFDITFNKVTKEFNLSFVDFFKNSTFNNINELDHIYLSNCNLKIIIAPKFAPQHNDVIWNKIERPSLETKYFIGEHLDSISIENQELIIYMIHKVLKKCRDQNVIKFDTDKDIRRCIALKLNQPWYIFPG